MRLRLVMTAAGFVMSSAALVACGEDTPAVCGSADQLQSSFDDLKDIDVTEDNGLDEFKSQLETVDGDLDQLTNDAKSEFSTQVDAVTATFEALGASAKPPRPILRPTPWRRPAPRCPRSAPRSRHSSAT